MKTLLNSFHPRIKAKPSLWLAIQVGLTLIAAGCTTPPTMKSLAASTAIAEAEKSAKTYISTTSDTRDAIIAIHTKGIASAAANKAIKEADTAADTDVQDQVNTVTEAYVGAFLVPSPEVKAFDEATDNHLTHINGVIAYLNLLEKERAIVSAYLHTDIKANEGNVKQLSENIQALATKLNQ